MEFDYSMKPGKRELKKEVNTDEKPLVSIITPYYNSEKYFEETYRSVMNQTFPHFEWIIVNDGSDEKNSEYLKEVEKRDIEASKPFKGTEDYATFKDAYFVGLIVFKPLFSMKLNLEDEYGFSEEFVLCDTSSEYKTVPVYQAYLNFCELDTDVKNAVKKRTEEYLSFEDDSKTQQVIDNTQVIANKFNPDYIKMLQENCKICNDPVGSTSFIKKFVMDFTAFDKMIKTSF